MTTKPTTHAQSFRDWVLSGVYSGVEMALRAQNLPTDPVIVRAIISAPIPMLFGRIF